MASVDRGRRRRRAHALRVTYAARMARRARSTGMLFTKSVEKLGDNVQK